MGTQKCVMTERLYGWCISRKGGQPTCRVCGDVLYVGEEFIAINGNHKTKRYCLHCAQIKHVSAPARRKKAKKEA